MPAAPSSLQKRPPVTAPSTRSGRNMPPGAPEPKLAVENMNLIMSLLMMMILFTLMILMMIC